MALLAAPAVSACAPPDRPARLPEPLPPAVLEYVEPHTVETRRVAPGVWYRFLHSDRGPWAVHVVEAELRRCELGLDVIRAAEAGERDGLAPVTLLDGAPSDRSVLVAVNGDFFTPAGVPLGPELTAGVLRTVRERPALAWRAGGEPWIGRARIVGDSVLRVGWPIPISRAGGGGGSAAARDASRRAEEGARQRGEGASGEVIGGYPELLDGGERVADLAPSDNPGFAARRHPRTAVGHDPSSGRLWLVVVDGRQGGYSMGMTLPELTDLLEALGATEALNLDGGGSSVMVVRGRTVTRPSDEAGEREVANALALRRDPGYCAATGVRPPG